MNTPPLLPDPRDESHLRDLAIGYFVMAALTSLFALLPLIHVGVGLLIINRPDTFGGNGQPPPAFIGYLLVGIGSFIIVLGQSFACCLLLAGRWIKARRNYLFSFVIACICCAFFPFGTVLGVFSILILSRESVKRLYAGAVTAPAAA